MYSLVLAAALTTGQGLPADVNQDVQDLKRAVAELQRGQDQFREDALKLVIAGLRQRLVDEKLDEIRRDVMDLRMEEELGQGEFHHQALFHQPLDVMPREAAAEGRRALLHLYVPHGATFYANDKEVAVNSPHASFITPVLEPGKDYYYDFKVSFVQDGKTVSRTKCVHVSAGEVISFAYTDMDEGR